MLRSTRLKALSVWLPPLRKRWKKALAKKSRVAPTAWWSKPKPHRKSLTKRISVSKISIKAAYDAASAAVAAAQSQAQLAHNGAQQEDKAASQGMEDVARASVMEVQSLLEDQILVAPCDGEVSEIFPHEGELVALGTPIMTISKIQDMWVAFSVREEMLSKLPMDTVLTVTIPALDNKEAKMKVYYIHDMGSYAVWNATKAYGQYDSKTFTVKMRPMDHIEGFRPGMSVLLPE